MIDYNPVNKFVAASKKLSGSSPTGFFGVKSGGNRGRSPGAYTRRHQSVVKNGGHASAQAAKGVNGLKVTRVNRKVSTYPNYKKSDQMHPGVATRRSQTVTKGGGHPRRAIVQAKPASVKVRPEC